MPIPLMARVETARVGHMPSISTRVGFSFTMPFQMRSKYFFMPYSPPFTTLAKKSSPALTALTTAPEVMEALERESI